MGVGYGEHGLSEVKLKRDGGGLYTNISVLQTHSPSASVSDPIANDSVRRGLPAEHSLVDEEHDGSVGYNAHEMSAEAAVERACAFLSDDEA